MKRWLEEKAMAKVRAETPSNQIAISKTGSYLEQVVLYNISMIKSENVYIFSIYYNRENVQKLGIYNILINKYKVAQSC